MIDDNDEVVDRVSIDDIYKKNLSHRIVHVLIFNKKGDMALQLRSHKKKFCPNHWSTGVGGHVQSGEDYDQAARREFREELGVETKLVFISKDWYETGDLKKLITTFRAVYEGEFKINLDEVQKIEYFSLETVRNMIGKGDKFHPELKFLLSKYYKID